MCFNIMKMMFLINLCEPYYYFSSITRRIKIVMTLRKAYITFFALISIGIVTFTNCNRKEKKADRLQKFNSELWKADKNGCNGDRLQLKNDFLSLKHNMRGFKSSEIEALLGKPDAQELYNRSQRYYIYFLDPGPKCENAKSNPQALFVRFSAVGIANEFTIKAL